MHSPQQEGTTDATAETHCKGVVLRERNQSHSFHLCDILDDKTTGKESRVVVARGYEWGEGTGQQEGVSGEIMERLCILSTVTAT